MGSIAMDKAGNIALGYSTSSSSINPQLRHAVHRIGDSAGSMLPEATFFAGSGSQRGSNRWGDYSAMSIDPADDRTFWFTGEYYATSSLNGWTTRIGKFNVLDILRARSVAANDGDILESGENSGIGGSIAASAAEFRLGDDALDRQFRAILDFETAALPDTAVITGAQIRFKAAGAPTGTDPFTTHGRVIADIREGAFSWSKSLQPGDFQSGASQDTVAALRRQSGTWFAKALDATALASINKVGHTQIRLRFSKGDDDDGTADIQRFFSGNATQADRPKLFIDYYVP
jgi:hypothetical protein